MILDDFLIAMIMAGFVLACTYLKSEYASHVSSKAAARDKTLVVRDLRVARANLEQNGISVRVRIVHAPLQRQSIATLF